MIVLSPEEMRQRDKSAIEQGFPEILLMEEAGRSTAQMIYNKYREKKELTGHHVLILCGKGNNGGDGLVIARFLDMWGFHVKIVLTAQENEMSQVSAKNLKLCQLRDIEIINYQANDKNELYNLFANSDIIVDALLGIGITGKVRGKAQELISLTNQYGAQSMICAVDIPSGISAESGQILGQAIQADFTMTMAYMKTGLTLYPGRSYAGETNIVDIGIPPVIEDSFEDNKYILEEIEAKALLPQRTETGHKGSFGKVAVIGGAEGMSGAPALTAQAALKTGAGLVRALVPQTIQDVVAAYNPAVMTEGLAVKENKLSLAAWSKIKQAADNYDVFAVGPGMDQSEDIKQLVEKILTTINKPVVLDADAINVLDKDVLKQRQAVTILTPHPGEMARLIDKEIEYIKQNRIKITKEFAREYDVCLILKGAATTVGLADGDLFINPTGDHGLATAGSGDVLTGVLAGLLAQGLKDAQAAVLAPYIHGKAGQLGQKEKTAFSLTADEIIEFLPAAFKKLQ